MNPLEPPDSQVAAQGWLDLGKRIKANAELERTEPKQRAHPDVLDVRWQVYALAGKGGRPSLRSPRSL